MKKKTWHSFVKSHYLVNRVYDMLDYFKLLDNTDEIEMKKRIITQIQDIYYVESLAKFFEDKLKKNKKKVEVRCNLIDLIHDLDYLKQYLSN